MGVKRIYEAAGEEEAISHSMPRPQFKYRESLSSWFTCNGKAYPVRSAPREIYHQFLSVCSVGMRSKMARLALLNSLLADDSPELRWFLLCEFRAYGVKRIPLYSSEEDAKATMVVYNHP